MIPHLADTPVIRTGRLTLRAPHAPRTVAVAPVLPQAGARLAQGGDPRGLRHRFPNEAAP
jgi:hypothetical protein